MAVQQKLAVHKLVFVE